MRKRIFFTLFTFIFVSNFSFAAFPLKNNHVTEFNISTSKEKVEIIENGDNDDRLMGMATSSKSTIFKILSLSFSGASIICTLSGALGLGILFLIPAIVFVILAMVYK